YQREAFGRDLDLVRPGRLLECLGGIAGHRLFAPAFLTKDRIIDRAFPDVLDQRGRRWLAGELVQRLGVQGPAAGCGQQAANPDAPDDIRPSEVLLPTLHPAHRSLLLTRQGRLRRETLEFRENGRNISADLVALVAHRQIGRWSAAHTRWQYERRSSAGSHQTYALRTDLHRRRGKLPLPIASACAWRRAANPPVRNNRTSLECAYSTSFSLVHSWEYWLTLRAFAISRDARIASHSESALRNCGTNPDVHIWMRATWGAPKCPGNIAIRSSAHTSNNL